MNFTFVQKVLLKLIYITFGWLIKVENRSALTTLPDPLIFAFNHNCIFEAMLVQAMSKLPFSSSDDKKRALKIWYTDDERRFPVNISLEFPAMGVVEFELERVEVW